MVSAGEGRSTRAGRYVRQPVGYRAFLPEPPPPEPPVDYPALREALSAADYALGHAQNRALVAARDTLLPRLLSGKLRVLVEEAPG